MRLKTLATMTIAAASFGLIITTQSGCLVAAAAAAGAGTYAYVNGQMTANYDAPVSKIAAAAKASFEDMKAIIIENQPNGPEAKVYGRTPTDHRVEVLIRSITENASKVSVRVDNFGDEGISRDMLSRIEQKLKG